MAKYELSNLPYNYSDLEPYIDTKTLEIHHTKHHQSYVDGLNKAHNALENARETSDFVLIKHWKRELSFNGCGHVLHTLYWESMCAPSKSKNNPQGKLLDAIEKKFKSFGTFVKEFKSAVLAVEGNGWVVLAVKNAEIEILIIEKHQNFSYINTIAIMACDVWEHAYYLNYQNKKVAYVDAFFSVIDWNAVEKRYEKAIKNTIIK